MILCLELMCWNYRLMPPCLSGCIFWTVCWDLAWRMKVGWDAPNERGRKTVDLGQMAITETREVCSADSSCSCHNLSGCWIFFYIACPFSLLWLKDSRKWGRIIFVTTVFVFHLLSSPVWQVRSVSQMFHGLLCLCICVCCGPLTCSLLPTCLYLIDFTRHN